MTAGSLPATIDPPRRNEHDDRSRHVLMMAPDCFMIDRRILQQARTLVRAGYRVTLISGAECAAEEHFVSDGVDVHRFQFDWNDQRLRRLRASLPRLEPVQRLASAVFLRFVGRLLPSSSLDLFIMTKARQFRADIVHIHDLPFLKYGVRLAAEWGVPLVFDTHEIYHAQASMSVGLRSHFRRQERRGVPHVDLFMTVNDAIADWYRDRYGKRPMVVMNSAEVGDIGNVADRRIALRRMAGVPESARIVLYQGWFSDERNIDSLVRAVRWFDDDTYLVLIGYGDYGEVLKTVAASTGRASRVKFLGAIDSDKLLRLTSGADIGVIPYQPVDLNHELCSPNKFFEYMQVGVPVLAHDLVFFRTMAREHGVVRTADLSTAESLWAALNPLLNDPDCLSRMRAECAVAARAMNWSVEGDKLLDAYEALHEKRCHAPAAPNST